MPTLLVELYVHYGEQCAFLKTLKTELPYDPAIPLLGTYLEKTLKFEKILVPLCS